MGVSTSFFTFHLALSALHKSEKNLDKIMPDNAVFKQNSTGTVDTLLDVSYCPWDKYLDKYAEFFLVPIFLYSVRIHENTEQKKLRIWKFSTQ